jgi:endogenous inhibitor of DNA gyrase (YacG/DUF329 family)
MGTKKVECCECGKEIEVSEDIDPEEIAIFCSDECIQAESRRAYADEMRKQTEEREKC